MASKPPEEKKCGLWPKEHNGKHYHSGKIIVNGKQFYADLWPVFSDNPKAPAFHLYLKFCGESPNFLVPSQFGDDDIAF